MEKCYHCGLEFLNKKKFKIFINNSVQYMCCPGCLAVSKFILDAGFSNYYFNREKPGLTINDDFINKKNFNLYDNKDILKKYLKKEKKGYSLVFYVEGITCSACTWLIERHFSKISYVKNVFVNLSNSKVFVYFYHNKFFISEILNEFFKIGYSAQPYDPKLQDNILYRDTKKEIKKILISGICLIQVMMLSFALYFGEVSDMSIYYRDFIRFFCLIFTIPVLFYSASNIFFNAFKSFIFNNYGMDITISLSLSIAFFFSIYNTFYSKNDVFFDSICMFVFFLLIGRYMEIRARYHSNEILNSLQKMGSDKILLLEKNKNNFTEKKIIPVNNLNINDYILIKPGEYIPVDSIVFNGVSNIDESMLTGENIPVLKKNGDFIYGGTINIDNKLILKVKKKKGYSNIDIMVNLLEKISYAKPKSNILINYISSYFTFFVILLTFVVSLIWFYVNINNVLNVILCMLVIACPCALSLATPVAITCTINTLVKNGFLITKSHVLENLPYIKDVVFDKTGTLTTNNFYIKNIVLNRNSNFKNIFSISYILEKHSKHPISNAFLCFNNINYNYYYKSKIKNYLNNGIEGNINGNIYRIGKLNFIKNWVKKYDTLSFFKSGVIIALADKKGVIAWFQLTNPLRKNVKNAILKLKTLNLNLHILSGDSSGNVDYISKILNIEKIKKNATTEDKLKYIRNLNSNVIMIGDGINDSLAFASSDISISMGSGVDLARINSDAVLLNNDLRNIYNSIVFSKKTNRIIKENIIWSIFYNFIGLFIAAINLITPYYAAIGMSFSSLIVVFNSLRLKKK